MRSRILVFIMATAFLTQPLFALSKTGMYISGALAFASTIALVVSAIHMGGSADVKYCPVGTEEAISGTYDCSYQECAYYQYHGDPYYCGGYFNHYGLATQNCQYVNSYTTCSQWRNIPLTCNNYACKNNSTGQFQDYSHRRDQPRYDDSKIATIVSGAFTGISLIGLLVSGLVHGGCNNNGDSNASPAIQTGQP